MSQLFKIFKKKRASEIMLGAPIKGKAISLTKVNDPTFRDGMLGKGVAMIPTKGKVYAPADGQIGLVFDTLHAISITTAEGVEVLIHVGLDTVTMKGDGFQAYVQAGDNVKKGDLLLTMDLEKIKAAGLDTITPVIICNTEEYEEVQALTAEAVEPGADVIQITLKK